MDISKRQSLPNIRGALGGGRMKEQTYGWYPSAKNVYDERRMGAPTPYQLEALYRYRDTKYYSEAVTPEQNTPGTAGRSQVSRASSHKSATKAHSRTRSAPIRTTYKPPPKLNLPTPQQCWSTHVPETEITVMPSSPAPSAHHVPPTPPTSVQRSPPVSVQRTPTPQSVQVATPPPPDMPAHSGHPDKALEKVIRIQSARVRRDSPSIPQRPSRSAGPVRPSPSPVPVPTHQIVWGYPQAPSPAYSGTPDIQISSRPPSGKGSVQRSPAPCHEEVPPCSMRTPSTAGRPPSGKKTPLRPKAPSPSKMEQHLELELDRAETPDYEAETRKHGWMMEIHGDPFKLKKVSKRLPYTVKVPEPETERDPPKIHMENIETFFLNTIPRRPMAFAIDKEWISETIHKKRMEMQAKHGLNYRYKNFSFVY